MSDNLSDNLSDPGRIERDLDRTRSRLGSHLSELQDRLSPGQVLDDAMKYFRGSDGAEFGRNLLDSVRANPLPAALTGIGLAWLMASGPRGGAEANAQPAAAMGSGRVRVYGGTSASGSAAGGGLAGGSAAASRYDAMALRLHGAEQAVTRGADEDEHVYVTRRDDARGEAVGLKRQAQEDAQSFGQRIREAIASAQDAATRGLHDMGARAGEVAGSVSSAAQGALGGVTQGGRAAGDAGASLAAAIGGSPVLLGALGLAAGALLGALLPVSEQETQALGGVAGQARDTARDLAQQALDRGGQVAQAVVGAGRDSAEAHGLMAGKSAGELLDAAVRGDLAGNAAQVARDVLNAGEGAVRGQAEGGQGGGQKPA